MHNLPKHIPVVDEVKRFNSTGPWDSKSGGKLHVLFGLPLSDVLQDFFTYDAQELAPIPEDIRGLRSYVVRGIPQGSVGAREWHRVRSEVVVALEGRVRWTCEDLHGDKRTLVLESQHSIYMPPFTLHTYEALEENSGLLVIANTLFNPQDATTHDTYSIEAFRDLQSQNRSK